MPPTSESGLVNSIVRAVLKEHPDTWVFKTVGNPYQMSGVPDLIFCVGGRFVALEVKFRRPGESDEHARLRATPQQRYQIQKINQAGGVARVVTSPADALAAVARALEWRDESETGTDQ